MLTPNTDGVPVTRRSEGAKAGRGVRLSATTAKIENRMLTSFQGSLNAIWAHLIHFSPIGLPKSRMPKQGSVTRWTFPPKDLHPCQTDYSLDSHPLPPNLLRPITLLHHFFSL